MGKSVAHMRSEILQSGERVCLRASFASPRGVDLRWQNARCQTCGLPVNCRRSRIAGWPIFCVFDFALVERLPMSAGDTAILRTWIRPKTPAVIDTELAGAYSMPWCQPFCVVGCTPANGQR